MVSGMLEAEPFSAIGYNVPIAIIGLFVIDEILAAFNARFAAYLIALLARAQRRDVETFAA